MYGLHAHYLIYIKKTLILIKSRYHVHTITFDNIMELLLGGQWKHGLIPFTCKVNLCIACLSQTILYIYRHT